MMMSKEMIYFLIRGKQELFPNHGPRLSKGGETHIALLESMTESDYKKEEADRKHITESQLHPPFRVIGR